MSDSGMVRSDINFLEYPTWVLSKAKGNSITITRENGTYELKSPEALPNDTDSLVLYYLMYKALDKETGTYAPSVETTRYDIAMNLYGQRTPAIYRRIEKALSRWTAIYVTFKGLFYNGVSHGSMGFHFLESFYIDESDKRIVVTFNREYINHLNRTKYFRYISFKELKKMKRPMSRRLYEILIKSFKERSVWCISTSKLIEKLTLVEKYPSKVIEKVIPAINEINKNTQLFVSLETYKNNDGETIFKFRKEEKAPANLGSGQVKSINKSWIMALIPAKYRTPEMAKLINGCKASNKTIVSNVRYVNGRKCDNYLEYLRESMQKDWGKELRAIEEANLVKYAEIVKVVSDRLSKEQGVDTRVIPYIVLDILRGTIKTLGDDRYFTSDYVIAKACMEENEPWEFKKVSFPG